MPNSRFVYDCSFAKINSFTAEGVGKNTISVSCIDIRLAPVPEKWHFFKISSRWKKWAFQVKSFYSRIYLEGCCRVVWRQGRVSGQSPQPHNIPSLKIRCQYIFFVPTYLSCRGWMSYHIESRVILNSHFNGNLFRFKTLREGRMECFYPRRVIPQSPVKSPTQEWIIVVYGYDGIGDRVLD